MIFSKKRKEEIPNKVEEQLKEKSRIEKEELFLQYKSSYQGLSKEEVEEKIEFYGKNKIEVKGKQSVFHRLIEAVINPFNIVLIIVAVITFITDIVIAVPKDYATFLLIIGTIFLSSMISFIQQTKSDQAVKQLKNMIYNKIDVIRENTVREIPVEEIVPGDILKLAAGDMIPADVRFLEVKDLFIDQASLTGEANPVEKFQEASKEEEITDIVNLGFMGTNVVSGTASAIVLATGNHTYFGKIAQVLENTKEKNSFEKGVDSISKLLIKFMIVMIPIIFMMNLFTKKNSWESLLFAITIAVGLTPEMLPVIMTSTLAKGAIEMSKRKTIMKRLSAIQTFGEMNLLCTDKTGTLTEDKIVLETYRDVRGKESLHILKHAFLNSYFQTGLKNLIDVAIIERADKQGLQVLKENYQREDEIPFDFSRRRMSVVLKDETGKRQLITKGAVEEIFSICSYIEIEGKVEEMTSLLRKQAYETYETYHQQGLRILAIAQKNEIHGIENFGVQDENDMVLLGFIGFLDPPKESAKEAISALKAHGVETVVLTGDSEGVAIQVCKKVGITVKNSLTGKEIENMTDEELKNRIKECHLYSKLSPLQKQRIVRLYQKIGNTVGYMGDGINDSPALKQADVGISVDTAVDIAKETADIILLEKDLKVLEEGVIHGRKTFTNVLKYIKMATSGNFGNMLSVMIASLFLPFLPLLPIHILMQNLLCDFAQMGMPFDHVDPEYIEKPKKWDMASIKTFMLTFGMISVLLDIGCFAVLWFVLKYNNIDKANLFQTGWFAFGTISQTFIIHMIRTHKLPFIQSKSSKPLVISTFSIIILTLVITFTNIAIIFDLSRLPIAYFLWMILLLGIYIVVIQVYKKQYISKKKTWL